MECRDTERLIDAYWDRELPDQAARDLTTHLSGCPRCGREFGAISTLLSVHEPVAPPTGLRARVLNAIPPAGKRQHPSDERCEQAPAALYFQPLYGAAAACVALLFVGIIALQLLNFGPRPSISGPPVAVTPPEPSIISVWAQAITLPGQFHPVAAFAQAAVVHQVAQPPSDAAVARRSLIREHGNEPTSTTPELPFVIAGLSSLGA